MYRRVGDHDVTGAEVPTRLPPRRDAYLCDCDRAYSGQLPVSRCKFIQKACKAQIKTVSVSVRNNYWMKDNNTFTGNDIRFFSY